MSSNREQHLAHHVLYRYINLNPKLRQVDIFVIQKTKMANLVVTFCTRSYMTLMYFHQIKKKEKMPKKMPLRLSAKLTQGVYEDNTRSFFERRL